MLARWVLVLPFALAALGCTELADLDAGCGNGVIETEKEDCDSSDPSCRPPGDELECRLDCSNDPGSCPAGWSCSVDSICQLPSGEFSISNPNNGIALRLTHGDLDGDGVSDLVANQLDFLMAHFFERDGSLAASTVVGASQFSPVAVGPLATHEGALDAPDVVVNARDDVSIYLGQTDRTLATKAYATIPVDVEQLRYIVFRGLPMNPLDGQHQGSEILGFVSAPQGVMVVDIFNDDFLFQINSTLDDLERGVTTADLDPSTPCDEFTLTAEERTEVAVYNICKQNADATWSWKRSDNHQLLTLPPNLKIIGDVPNPEPRGAGGPGPDAIRPPLVVAGDVNADGVLDLLAQALEGQTVPVVVVAYGVANGTFHSQTPVPQPASPGEPIPPGDGKFAVLQSPEILAFELPLAIGNLNNDGVIDVVSRSGVFFSTTGATTCPMPQLGYECVGIDPQQATRSSKAVILDFNGNGTPDVATLSEDGNFLSFFNGTGPSFIETRFATSGTFFDFGVGDLDGDLLPDIALQELAFTGSGVAVAYAKPFGAPEQPVTVARFAALEQIGVGNFSLAGGDAIDDVGVLTRSASGTLGAGLLSGSTDRRLESPFTLLIDNPPPSPDLDAFARSAAVGQFDDDGHADVVVLSAAGSQNQSGFQVDWDPRLWLMPSTGEAEIERTTVTYSPPINERTTWCGATLTAIDLNNDQRDETVIFSTEWTGTVVQGIITVASVQADDSGKNAWTFSEPQTVPELYGDQFAALECQFDAGLVAGPLTEGLPVVTQPVVTDIDRDGDRDLLVLGYLADGPTFRPRLRLYRNSGSGVLDVGESVDLGVAADERVMALGAIQADRDPELEILIATTLPNPEDNGGGLYLAQIDPTTGQPSDLQKLTDTALFSLTVADFDGNGVEDFAAGSLSGLTIGFGQAVRP